MHTTRRLRYEIRHRPHPPARGCGGSTCVCRPMSALGSRFSVYATAPGVGRVDRIRSALSGYTEFLTTDCGAARATPVAAPVDLKPPVEEWTCFTRHPGLVLVLARGRSAPAAGSATAQAWLSCRVAGTDLVADAPHDLVPECTPVGERTGLLPPPDEFGDSRQGPGGLDGALKGTGARWPGRVWTGTGARRGPAVRQGQRKRRFCVGAVR